MTHAARMDTDTEKEETFAEPLMSDQQGNARVQSMELLPGMGRYVRNVRNVRNVPDVRRCASPPTPGGRRVTSARATHIRIAPLSQ